jgi:mycothiol synthase
MGHPLRIELRSRLDERVLRDILALIDTATQIEGHRPVGEHKHSHLRVGAEGWVGILAYEGPDLVGYAHTRWNPPEAHPRLAVEVVVHPDHHHDGGVTRVLLLETRGVLGRAGGGTMWLWVHRVDDAADTLAARMGMLVQRELLYMTRPLDGRPETLPLPEGVEIRPFRAGADETALLEVNNAAFAGHPENGSWDRAELHRRMALPWFDPAGLLLAWRGEQLLGFHWTKWHSHDSEETPAHEPVGEVYVLGVAPDAQGLGLGRILLRAGLAHLHDRGCRLALLYVDSASTGAVELYRSDGFDPDYREVCYADLIPPVVEHLPDDLRRPAF